MDHNAIYLTIDGVPACESRKLEYVVSTYLDLAENAKSPKLRKHCADDANELVRHVYCCIPLEGERKRADALVRKHLPTARIEWVDGPTHARLLEELV